MALCYVTLSFPCYVMLSITERRRHVARMRTNFALEGLLPDATDLVLQGGYISGQLSLVDLLAYARAYAEMCVSETSLLSSTTPPRF